VFTVVLGGIAKMNKLGLAQFAKVGVYVEIDGRRLRMAWRRWKMKDESWRC
jgi:hypothetical protein